MCINPPVPTGRFSLNPAASAADAPVAALPGAPPHWRQQVQHWMAAAQRSHDAITLAQAAEQAMARVQAHLARMHARMQEIAAAVPTAARPALVKFLRSLTEEMEQGRLDIGGQP